MPGAENFSALDRKLTRLAAELLGGAVEEQCAHLGADQADRSAADRDRIATRREAFARTDIGLARHQPHLFETHVEFLGGDLAERGQDALADLDLATADANAVLVLECDPLRQDRIVDQALRQSVRDHDATPAARATARITRLCMPQRQRCGSSAATMSARLGLELFASSAAAETRMPERQ